MSSNLVWRPQAGPQKALVDCPIKEVFFGGARGGGKTDGVLGKWALKEAEYGSGFNAIMFRRTTVSSEDAIDRSKQIYGTLGGKFNESKLIWRMPNGGRVAFAYLDKVTDADEYQGRNVTDAWVEEAGQYPDSAPIDRLFGVLRSAQGVPIQLILTANPGGAGQGWLRERYKLHPFPQRPMVLSRPLPNGAVHQAAVIPSRIQDNKILLGSDPGYVDRSQMVGGAALVRAWLSGDWSAIEGAFFDGWDEEKHVLTPFDIPKDWTRFRSIDWGYAAPFSVGWWAVVQDQMVYDGLLIPRGALIRYREWYGCQKDKPNVGIRQDVEQVAQGIRDRSMGEEYSYTVVDPSMFAQSGGPSLAERFCRAGVYCRRGDNTRIAKIGAMGGWDQMRSRLRGDGEHPALYVFNTCLDFIRTIPMLQHDPVKAEDLDTEQEDHVADEARYACMSRPYVRREAEEPRPKSGIYRAGPNGQIVGVLPSVEEIIDEYSRSER